MAANNFDPCMKFVLQWEGGKSNDPHDPGGRTNEGVTQRTYDSYRARAGLPREDVYNMQPLQRDAIYRGEYWDRIKGDNLPRGEDLCVFDEAVNSGPARALETWRASIVAPSNGPPVPTSLVIERICKSRLSFLRALRTWRYFGTGWGRRVAACEATALRMANVSSVGIAMKRDGAQALAGRLSATTATGGAAAATLTAITASGGHIGAPTAVASLATIGLAATLSSIRARQHRQRAEALHNESKRTAYGQL